jgi:adenosylmethionine-8-amino-7-oxononanoate aminotransferase
MAGSEKEYINKNNDYIIRPLPWRPHLSDLVITEARGLMLKDINGKEYMDMYASWNTSCIGHGRKEVADAIIAQMAKFDFTPIAAGPITRESCDLAEKLVKITPTGLRHFWFTNGGSEANDYAIRVARQYWMNRNKQSKNKIVSLTTSYHGATLGMRLVSGNANIQSPDYIHVPPPYCYRCPWGKTYPDCKFECAQALAKAIDDEGEDNIAAFVCEPVMIITNIVPPEGYWSRVRKICDDRNVLIVADEVMCGMGLTGKWWASQAMMPRV